MPRTLIFLLSLCMSCYASAAKVAIIMDDIGYRQSDINTLNLPVAVTFSILPYTPLGQQIAQQAAQQQREIMLHMPMEADNGKYPGPGAVMANMSAQSIQQQLQLALNDLPQAVGLNNHMGSKVTQMPAAMQAMAEWLAKQNLYFVDSRTTVRTRAEQAARAKGIATLHRHVFLDNQLSEAEMQAQLRRLIALAKKQNNAIAIAHPHPQTVAFLADVEQRLRKHGIELVPVSQLFPPKQLVQQSHKPPAGDKAHATAR